MSYGGKADALLALRDAGYAVPPFWVLSPDGEVLAARGAPERSPFGKTPPTATYAVRSSATLEDGPAHSFAGQFATRLHVASGQLAEAIAEVAASVRSPRVETYLTSNGLDVKALRVFVVVQEMIDARVSGVAFGADPVTGLLDVALVAAVYGLGEGLVDGTLDGDQATVYRDGRVLRQIVRPQGRRLVRAGSQAGGTTWEAVPDSIAGVAKLSAAQLAQVAATAGELGAERGAPQDIEFAYDRAGTLWLLQSRPITTLGPGLRVYDNSNIVESYPGLTQPYTFAFIRRAYASVYRQLCQVLGVRAARIDAHPEAYESLLAHLGGRVYYDLNAWYGVLSLLPGYRLNARAMERMMGVAEPLDLPPLPQPSRVRAGFDSLTGALGLLRAFRNLPAERRGFRASFAATLAEYRAQDYGALASSHLADVHERFESTLTERWRAPLVNDFFAMIAFAALRGLAERWNLPQPQSIVNELLAGAGEVISTQPASETLALSALVLDDADALAAFGDDALTDGALWSRIRADPQLAAVRDALDGYLERWGARTIGELKLETVTYEQRPIAYLATVRAYVARRLRPRAAGVPDPAQVVREAAEQHVRDSLTGWRRRVFGWVLAQARTLVAERENLRYERTRGFAEVRRMALARGARLTAAGRLEEPADVFWLTRAESEANERDLRALVARRRTEYARFASAELPERIRLRGADSARVELAVEPFLDTGSRSGGPVLPKGASPETLLGTPCCAGVVVAPARVVTDPTDVGNLAGGILVTRSTDPGWVTLFPTASAIAVERGSLLSHAAIVSREMGIPCVVGVVGLLATVRTGDRLRLDGATGRIDVLPPANPATS